MKPPETVKPPEGLAFPAGIEIDTAELVEELYQGWDYALVVTWRTPAGLKTTTSVFNEHYTVNNTDLWDQLVSQVATHQ